MTEENPEYSVQYKIILLGDSGVGKTSILFRYCKDLFTDVEATVGVEYQPKFIELNGKKIKLAIWDTAGQERFRTLTKSFYRNIQGAILVYDVTNPESLESLERSWMPELEANASPPYQKMVVGNKTDLAGPGSVPKERGEEVAKRLGALFVQTSAKTAEHVANAFEELVIRIIESTPDEKEPRKLEINKTDGQSQDDFCFC